MRIWDELQHPPDAEDRPQEISLDFLGNILFTILEKQFCTLRFSS